MPKTTPTLVALALLTACTREPAPIVADEGLSLRAVRAAADELGTMMALDLSAVDATGQPLPCGTAEVEVSVSMSWDGGESWTVVDDADVRQTCGREVPHDVALVLDNSGSQVDALEATREGARRLATEVLEGGGRVSLVRVSTSSTVLTGLTDDPEEVHARIDDLHVADGWTALYDGVRMGNETLGSVLGAEQQPDWSNLDSFCDEHRGFEMVAFTNGVDNNSAQQRLATSTNDGIDTAFDDLLGMQVGHVRTPIHTVGLGADVDPALLSSLSTESGGQYLAVAHSSAVPDAFSLIASYAAEEVQVCAALPSTPQCGRATVRVEATWVDATGQTFSSVQDRDLYVACQVEAARGASATLLLTLLDPGIPESTASSLVTGAVRYVSRVRNPHVLLLQDDGHHNEDTADTDYVQRLMTEAGLRVTRLLEPQGGVNAAALAPFDVVWLNNPGWPLDDPATFDALTAVLADGRGVVLQGDDLTWSEGRAIPMDPITHLRHDRNGTNICGTQTDDRRGANYRVDVVDDDHPLTRGIAGASFLYGNDIDHSTPRDEGEEVLAWARLDGVESCEVRVPVVVAYRP